MRVVVRVLLVGFAFAIPWEYSLDLGEPIGDIARIMGLVVLMAAAGTVLLQDRMRRPGALQWLVLAFFLWFCCSCFWTIEEHTTLARLRGYLQCMLPVWVIWEFAERPEDLRNLLRAYVAGSWVLAGLTIASLGSPDAAQQIRFVAEGQDPNDVARFLDLGFPMTALLFDSEPKWRWRLLALGYFPLGLVGVLLTASRGGVLAAVAGLAGCAVLLARRHVRSAVAGGLSLPVIVAAFWLFVPHGTLARIATIPEQLARGDLNRRLNIWAAGWQAFVHAPFLGSGAGTFVAAAKLAPGDTAHNTALTIAVEGGMAALMMAAAILWVSAQAVLATRGAVRIALGTALVVCLATSMVASVEYNRGTWLLMALVVLAGRLSAQEPELMAGCFAGPGV